MKINSIRDRLLASTMVGGAALMALTAVSAVTLVTPTVAVAQDVSAGTMTGKVVDANGTPVAGASVEVRSNEQGFTRTTTTDAAGEFRSALVPIGSYTVTIQAQGFNPVVQTAAVRLGGTSSYAFNMTPAGSTGATELDEVVVTGARQALDFNQTTTGLSVDLQELIKEVPVGRSATAVTLLAPGVSLGDNAFGDANGLPSISGASVAENAYFINGLNITNFANFLGGSVVPFDFYRSMEVKTGGYSAEYGRSTGGFVNAVTKSGTNEFTGAIHGNWAVKSLYDQAPDSYAQRNALDERESTSVVVELGGPIIRDRLFFYGLAEMRDVEARDSSITAHSTTVQTSDDPFYGLKLDGYITQDHRLELTYFDTSRETLYDTYDFDPSTDTTGEYQASTLAANGGESWVARYTGSLTDWLTISAAYGKNKDSNSTLQTSDAFYALDDRSGVAIRVSPNQAGAANEVIEMEREFYRADADIYFNFLGDHHVRVGYDKEKNELLSTTRRPGEFMRAYYYHTASADTPQAQGGNLAVGEDYVEVEVYDSGGAFSGENEAYYIQDEWDVNDRLTLNLGVRVDKFLLNNLVGQELTNFDNEVGPRLGFAYDPWGDGQGRLYGFWGRYYMPIAANTASRMGGRELFYSEYFHFSGDYDANGGPIGLGAQIVGWDGATACPEGTGHGPEGAEGCTVTSSGELYDASTQIGQNLKSTMEEELILGYEHKFDDLWSANVSFTYRDLKRSAEDISIDRAVRNWCAANGYPATIPGAPRGCNEIWTGFRQYVLHNPGEDLEVILSRPLPGETDLRTVTLSASDLGYPKLKREYTALQMSFERANDGVWGLQGSYTLSESRGNFEGYVKSDNGQDDSGATTDFDQPSLMDGADGLLPNHHAHTFKLFGSYNLNDRLRIGANATLQSPRVYGCIGVHPTDPFAQAYENSSWYCQGELTPRGSKFSGVWYRNVDLSVHYSLADVVPFGNLGLRAEIFNVFGFKNATDFREYGDLPNGSRDVNYGKPTAFQQPRYVRLGFDWTF